MRRVQVDNTMRASLAPGGTKSSAAAGCVVKSGNAPQLCAQHRGHQHLRNTFAAPYDERLISEVDEDNDYLTAIVGVDRARRVEHGDAVACCETGARAHLR